eukprot:3276245-Rhodomonas_salina.3
MTCSGSSAKSKAKARQCLGLFPPKRPPRHNKSTEAQAREFSASVSCVLLEIIASIELSRRSASASITRDPASYVEEQKHTMQPCMHSILCSARPACC